MAKKKRYYSKEQIAQKLELQVYIVDLWSKQFGIDQMERQGEFVFSRSNLNTFKSIKSLLYEKGYTIDAAKKQLQDATTVAESPLAAATLFNSPKPAPIGFKAQLLSIREQLVRLRSAL